MQKAQAGATAPTKNIRWLVIAGLVLLLIAAVRGFLGPLLIVMALATVLVGVIAAIRGHLRPIRILNRKVATGVALAGVYLLALGAVIASNSADETLVAAATGDPCEVTGSINAQENETYFCTPSESGELTWASEADFQAHQAVGLEELEAQAAQEAEASAKKEIEEDLVAVEKRAAAAEAEITEYEAQIEDYEEQLTDAKKAAEEAEAAQAEAEGARQSQPAPTNDEPAFEAEAEDTGPTAPFENCAAAREAGADPVHRGDPGYGPHLDRDGDGIGCE